MKILHAKTPEFNFDEEQLDVLEDGGTKKVMQIHNIRSFANFMEEAEVKYDCIVLLSKFKSFLSFPQPEDSGIDDCIMLRFWGKYKQEYLDRFK
jgi:hypothetical protein